MTQLWHDLVNDSFTSFFPTVAVQKTAQYTHHVPQLNHYDYDYAQYDNGHYDNGHYY
jgi:hypothetical protein